MNKAQMEALSVGDVVYLTNYNNRRLPILNVCVVLQTLKKGVVIGPLFAIIGEEDESVINDGISMKYCTIYDSGNGTIIDRATMIDRINNAIKLNNRFHDDLTNRIDRALKSWLDNIDEFPEHVDIFRTSEDPD